MATGTAVATQAIRAVIGGFFVVSTSVVGCGGAASQEALESDPTQAMSTGGATSGGNTSGGSNTSGGNTNRPPNNGADAAVVPATLDCPKTEQEPNDDPDRANNLAPILCGEIKPNSESDFLTFVLDEKATTMQLKYDGQVTLKVEVNGQTVILGDGSSPKVPFFKRSRYVVEVKGTAKGGNIPWRVELIEQ